MLNSQEIKIYTHIHEVSYKIISLDPKKHKVCRGYMSANYEEAEV